VGDFGLGCPADLCSVGAGARLAGEVAGADVVDDVVEADATAREAPEALAWFLRPLVDHIIVGAGRYVSLKESGRM